MDASKVPENAVEVTAHQASMLDESGHLQDRIHKLTEFVNGTIYPTLDQEEQKLLLAQLEAMKLYAGILATRIMRFLHAT